MKIICIFLPTYLFSVITDREDIHGQKYLVLSSHLMQACTNMHVNMHVDKYLMQGSLKMDSEFRTGMLCVFLIVFPLFVIQ